MKKIIKTVLAICLCVSGFTGISCVGNTPNPGEINNNTESQIKEIKVTPWNTNYYAERYLYESDTDVYFIKLVMEPNYYANRLNFTHLQKDPITGTWTRKDFSENSTITYDAGTYKTAVITDSYGDKSQKVYTVHRFYNNGRTLDDQGMQVLVNLFEGYFTTDSSIKEGNCFLMVDLSCIENDESPKMSGLTALSWEKDENGEHFQSIIDRLNDEMGYAYDDENNLNNENYVH